MIFISLIKFKSKPDKKLVEKAGKLIKNPPKGVKVLSTYWTLGRYDAVWIIQAPSEKEAMRISLEFSDAASSETMVAVRREDAVKLLG